MPGDRTVMKSASEPNQNPGPQGFAARARRTSMKDLTQQPHVNAAVSTTMAACEKTAIGERGSAGVRIRLNERAATSHQRDGRGRVHRVFARRLRSGQGTPSTSSRLRRRSRANQRRRAAESR